MTCYLAHASHHYPSLRVVGTPPKGLALAKKCVCFSWRADAIKVHPVDTI
jgi:hypothetical protein